jgi:membrane-associated protease RseP (regulator of RpoE activity)
LADVDDLFQLYWLVGREFWPQGLAYSGAVLGILGAHEMGHYLACRRYDVDATLPYFLPFPSLSGTMGAVIKIREAFPDRTALFDIAVAGPIGGFVVLVPLLFAGMWMSNVVPVPADMQGFSLGEPLLFRLVAWLKFGTIAEGYGLNIHPIVFAAWFGMLATAWNLLPFGQLDGGHLTYATMGDRSRFFSLATVAGAIAMCFVSYSWLLMTAMMVAMLFLLGPRHPRVLAEYEPLGRGRYALAVVALIILIICFTPAPIDPL